MSEPLPQAELEQRIRTALPDLPFTTAVAVDYGEDNHVAVLDGDWIVRFPRSEEQRGRFIAELNLLRALRDISHVRVPVYAHVAADQSMGAYRMIQGDELHPPVFAALDKPARYALLADLGRFLGTLHALPEKTIVQPDGFIQHTWSGEQFAALYRGMRRAKLARFVPAAAMARFDAFHEAFESIQPGVPRLAHNDLTDDHILVRESGALAGIIDFSDAAYGDPAIDFAWFWSLGEDAVDLVLSHYPLAGEDAELKVRAHWTFVRYLINQIWYGERPKWNLPLDAALVEIDGHLKRLGF
jgi:aminoglycoside 2''-phosphotransferase